MSDKNTNPTENSPFQPPEGVIIPDIGEIERQRGELWEELTDRNWPPGRVQEALDRRHPLPRTSEQIEQEEAEAIARNLGATALDKPKRRTYKRRGYDPKGGGPPAHISAEIRGDPKD